MPAFNPSVPVRTLSAALVDAAKRIEEWAPPLSSAAENLDLLFRDATSEPHPLAPEVGATARSVLRVEEPDTAAAVGHPDPTMLVLASPRIALWFELATSPLMPAPESGNRHAGVGILVHHLGTAAVGDDVIVETTVAAVSGRVVVFSCQATAGDRLIAFGTHQRVILRQPS